MDSEKLIELLRQHHVFPGVYHFKVIGTAERGGALVREGIEATLLENGVTLVSLDYNLSAEGKYIAWRVHAEVQSPEQVIQLSGIFQGLAGVRVVM